MIPPPPSPLEFFARPRRLPVTGDDWQTAARLGLERVEANNATRTATQTRPMEKQVLQDVLGALAELVVVLACARVGCDHDTTLWDDTGGVASQAASDVVIRHSENEFKYDVKCHMALTAEQRRHLGVRQKFDFAVNVRSLDKAARRGTEFLLPVLAAPGGRSVLLGRALLVGKVRGLPQRDYGYGDPAYATPMQKIALKLFGYDFEECVRIVSDGATVAALDRLVPR